MFGQDRKEHPMPDLLIYSSITFNVILLSVAIALKIKLVRHTEKESNVIAQLADAVGENVSLNTEIDALEKEKTNWRDHALEASVHIKTLEEALAKLEEEEKILRAAQEKSNEAKQQAEIQLEASRQKLEHMQKVMDDWEKTKQQHLEAAKASVAEAGAQLSNKLLDDHKRESEEAKKQQEAVIKETTEELHKKFENIFFSMNSLHERVEKSQETVDLIERSLLSPAGAGALSEITLENIFKASGLKEERDYVLQHWLEGGEESKGGVRPDAIVFLPSDSALVIDSKASKFFVEIEKNRHDKEKREALESGLKKTMNLHLNDLIKRDYEGAVKLHMKKKSNNRKMHINALMFLPTDAAVEKLNEVDPKFMEKAWKEHIIPVGPSGLVSALLQANLLITRDKQEENSKRIIDEVKILLGSVAKLHSLADSVGKGIRSSLKKYDALAGSFNSNLISKVRKLDRMGVSLPKNTDLKKLERYQVSTDDLIEAEAIEAEMRLAIENEMEALADVE